MASPANKTSLLVVALAWLVVTIPLGWGVYQSAVKSFPLFRVSPSPHPPDSIGK
jgi:hypothetical protein